MRASIATPSAGQVQAMLPATLYHASGSDDAAAIAAILAGGHDDVQLASGETFAFPAHLLLPNVPVTLRGGPGVSIVSTIGPPPYGPMDSALAADAVQPQNGNGGALAASVATGAVTLSLTMAFKPIVGHWLAVSHGTSMEIFKAYAVTGSASPYSVAITDGQGNGHPTRQAYSSGDTVVEYASRPNGIRIAGGGLTISGPGNQTIEFARAEGCEITDVHLLPSAGTTGCGFDVGGRRNRAARCTAGVAGSGPQAGFYMQSQDDTHFEENASAGAQYGHEILDCIGSSSSRCTASECSVGFVFGSLPFSPGSGSLGNIDCWSEGDNAVDCATGCEIFGSTNFRLTRFSARRGSTYGILVLNADDCPTTTGTLLDECVTDDCGAGVLINAGVVGTVIRNHTANGCAVSALSAAGDVIVEGLVSTCSPSQAAIVLTCASATLTGLDLTVTGNVGVQCSGSLAEIRGEIACAGHLAVYVVTGTARLNECTLSGDRGLYVAAGQRAEIGPGCNLAGCATPVDFTGTGTITMQQTGGVAGVSATRALTFAEHYNTAIELGAGAGADTTITAYPIPGMGWDAANLSAHGLILQTTVVGTVTIAAGKSARVRVDSAGVMKRVSPDA